MNSSQVSDIVSVPRSSPQRDNSSASTSASLQRRQSAGPGVSIRPVPPAMASAERKTSPRPNQQFENEHDHHENTDDAEDDTHHDATATGDADYIHRSAVESAADALLQRLRTRARVAKPSTPSVTETEDNQQLRGEISAPPSPVFDSPAMQSSSVRPSLAQSTSREPISPPPRRLHLPLARGQDEQERYVPFPPPPAPWHEAFMAQAQTRRSPGEQLDLPDFGDDMSSDFNSSHGRIEELVDGNEPGEDDDDDEDEGAMSDGELMVSQQTLDHNSESESEGHAFDHSENELYDEDNDHESTSEFGGDNHDLHQEDHDHDGMGTMAMTVSNRDVNVTKAVALKTAMLRNLIRLGFDQDLARAAVDAGIHEIEQYDSDCELAYVDIFMTLVKLVCDAHHDVTTSRSPPQQVREQDQTASDQESPRVQFKWPVFDMAQFEFGNARTGTCFESVCVLINLPKVSMDRTEELMEVLSSCLFCMLGDPIQVLIPSVTATGRTKGHAFLEFDDPSMARACAAAVDGLTWGRGPYGRIRAKMFRQYQVKSPVPPIPASALSLQDEHGAFRLRRRLAPATSPQLQQQQQQQHQQQPYQIRSFHRSLPPSRFEDSEQQFRQSRELSRSDLNVSGMSSSSASWNTGSHASLGLSLDDSSDLRRRAMLSSLDDTAFHRAEDDGAMQLGELRLSSDDEEEGFDHDENDGDGESSATESDLELAEAILHHGRPSESQQTFRQPLPPLPMDPQMPFMPRSLGNASAASSSARGGPHAPTGGDIEGPWKAYCEELITRNREMQEQVAYARRRIAALGHNNQKLHLLIDRMERDRDGLMFENDLLQTQLHGYEDHERQQEALMKELAALRRRMKRRDQRIERGLLDSSSGQAGGMRRSGVAVDLEGGVMSMDELEEQLVQNILSSRRHDDLKEWEQMLESSLARVRSIKEEIAVELQKKLAQQADDQLTQDHKLCVVCLSSEKSILCLPCRHLCLCQECSQHEELDKCPICRLVVENMLLVYA